MARNRYESRAEAFLLIAVIGLVVALIARLFR